MVKWPKTPASHAGNSGSNPLRVTKREVNARITHNDIVGVDDVEGPPVPIPNTVVKLFSAENTWRAAAREDKATPTFFIYPKLRKRTAVNCFAGLRVRWTKKQSEKRKKHRAERAKAK